ncbi:MAG: HD domain-containing protein [Candidatus Odinarchaeia archaeon]
MDQQSILREIKKIVVKRLKKADPAHDIHHIRRVYRWCVRLGREYGGDIFVLKLAALLHDLSPRDLSGRKKFSDHVLESCKDAEHILRKLNVDEKIITTVLKTIEEASYDLGKTPETLEGKILRDADFLDAIGAIGVARCMAFSGAIGRPIFDPKIKPKKEYDPNNATGTAINHFYEKLLKLKNYLSTPKAIEVGKKRHTFLKRFLEQFMQDVE